MEASICCELGLVYFGNQKLEGGPLAPTLLDIEGDKPCCCEIRDDGRDGSHFCGIFPDDSWFCASSINVLFQEVRCHSDGKNQNFEQGLLFVSSCMTMVCSLMWMIFCAMLWAMKSNWPGLDGGPEGEGLKSVSLNLIEGRFENFGAELRQVLVKSQMSTGDFHVGFRSPGRKTGIADRDSGPLKVGFGLKLYFNMPYGRRNQQQKGEPCGLLCMQAFVNKGFLSEHGLGTGVNL